MTAIRHLTLLVALVWCDQAAAQSYKLISETRFALRIHITSFRDTQQPRVAGADHLVSKPLRDKLGLELKDTGGMVIIEGDQYPLSPKQSQMLRQGSSVVVAKEFEITLSSDAQERSNALLLVRSATATDKRILYLLEIKLVTTPTDQKAEQAADGKTPQSPQPPH